MIPKGYIMIWVGTIDEMPKGYAPCDGENGTIDLRDYVEGKAIEYVNN